MDEKEIIQELHKVNAKLYDIRQAIINKNSNGNQFDYVSSSVLGEEVLALEINQKKISGIVFQEK